MRVMVLALVLASSLGFSLHQDIESRFSHKGVEPFAVKVWTGERNWVEAKITFKPSAKPTDDGMIACSSLCNGAKHLLHTECDTTCDKPCSDTHEYFRSPNVTFVGTNSFIKDAQKFGLGENSCNPFAASINDKLYSIASLNTVTNKLKHWDTTPCSSSYKTAELLRYEVVVAYQFFRNDLGPDGTLILVQGPSGVVDAGGLTVPSLEFIDGKTSVQCRCSIVQEDVKDETSSNVMIINGAGRHVMTTKEEADLGFTVTCESMNTCTVEITNPGIEEFTCVIPPGTQFECVDGSAQNEVLCETLTIKVGKYETVRASIDTKSLIGPKATGRAACLNIHKPEPDSSKKFKLSSVRTSDVTALARYQERERFRGAWSQVRMWIATDQASRDEIGKVLIPKPTVGMYLRSLFEVAKVTHLELGDKFKACFEPGLVFGGTGTNASTEWYVTQWAKRDPKGFASWVSKNWAKLTEECLGDTADPVEVEHVSDLVTALARSTDPQLQALAAECLTKAVPESKRSQVAKFGALNAVMAWLSKESTDLANKALDVAELYKDPVSRYGLLNVNDSHGERAKERAFKIYQESVLTELKRSFMP